MSSIKYKQSWLSEVDRFDRTNRQAGSPVANDLGLYQFYEYESRGVEPETPDAYFEHLLNGKRWWEWTVNYIADSYATDDWPGWAALGRDFTGDQSGLRQIRQRIGLVGRDMVATIPSDGQPLQDPPMARSPATHDPTP